jgi:uridine kinase
VFSKFKNLSEEEQKLAKDNLYNFDHPNALDFDLLLKTLTDLKAGKKVNIPIYNFETNSREKEEKTIYGANVIIFEGVMAFFRKEIKDLIDIKIFVDTDCDIRLARRLKRDMAERGRSLESIIKQYNAFVKPAFHNYIAPTMSFADIIVPRGGDNKFAVDLIVKHAHRELIKKGCMNLKSNLTSKYKQIKDDSLPDSLIKLEETNQIKCMLTTIRNRETTRDELIFYSNRLMRLLIEYCLSLLSFENVTVSTPSGNDYFGKICVNKNICGASILGDDEFMEPALLDVFKDASIGKISFEINKSTGEIELDYLYFPHDIRNNTVLLMDSTLKSGATAIMTIQVLLDHSVQEHNIILLVFFASKEGIMNVWYAFPKVRIITTTVDTQLDINTFIIPEFGDSSI